MTVNLNKYFGVKGEFIGYGSSTDTFTISAPIVNHQATIPAGVYQVSGNLFTYLFGPVVKYRTPRAEPFGEILFGGAHTNVYRNLYTAAGITGNQPDNNGFAMAVGGGLDIPVSKMVAIRVAEIDYMLNRLGKDVFGTTTTNNLNNFRYQGGIVIYLGGK